MPRWRKWNNEKGTSTRCGSALEIEVAHAAYPSHQPISSLIRIKSEDTCDVVRCGPWETIVAMRTFEYLLVAPMPSTEISARRNKFGMMPALERVPNSVSINRMIRCKIC